MSTSSAQAASRSPLARRYVLAVLTDRRRRRVLFAASSGRRSTASWTTAILALAYVVMALGLNIVVGFAGLLDLGYVAFFAIGAYTVRLVGLGPLRSVNGEKGIHIGVSELRSEPARHPPELPDSCSIGAIIVCAIAGAIIGLPTLRLRGDYIAIVTLAFGEIIGRICGQRRRGHDLRRQQADQRPRRRSRRWTRSTSRSSSLHRRSTSDRGTGPRSALVLVVLFVNFRLRDSRLGRAWIALREDEVAAASMGVPLVQDEAARVRRRRGVRRHLGRVPRLLLNTVNADQFQFSFSIFMLAMVILGGLGIIWGVVLGAVLLSFINNRPDPRRARQALRRATAQGSGFDRSPRSPSGSSASCS